MRSPSALEISASPDALAESAARWMTEVIADALAARGVAFVALSGGSTPGPAYAALARAAVDWDEVHWFWVDERCVPPDDHRSNYRAAREVFLDPAGVPADRVHRIRGELAPAAAAGAYEAELYAHFELQPGDDAPVDALGRAPVRFDCLVAGIGTDGHTASLFPGTGAVAIDDRLVTTVEPGGGLEPRVTLTRPVLVAARRVLVLATGRAKAPVIRAARTPGNEEAIPARVFLDADDVTWMVDQDAISRDASGSPPPLSPE